MEIKSSIKLIGNKTELTRVFSRNDIIIRNEELKGISRLEMEL
jgi:hypothetical protein